MSGVEGLHQGEHLRPPYLADDEAVGPEAQGRADQLFERDRDRAVRGGRSCLQAHEVVGGRQQLDGVLDRHDALARHTAPEGGVEQ